MYTNAGPSAIEHNKDLPSYQEITHKNNLYQNPNSIDYNQAQYNNNPAYNYPNNIPYNTIHPNPQNVIYVPQQIIVVEKSDTIAVNQYPILSTSIAIVILLVNVFFPGIGTMIIGCVSGQNVGLWICIGLLQILLAWIIIGWVWAIFTGIMILSASKN